MMASKMLWEQQGVLALFSALFASVYILLFDIEVLLSKRVIIRLDTISCLITTLQATQGLLVAIFIQRSGIILRLILGTLSVALCIVLEALAFGEPIVVNEVLVIFAIFVSSNLYMAEERGVEKGSVFTTINGRTTVNQLPDKDILNSLGNLTRGR